MMVQMVGRKGRKGRGLVLRILAVLASVTAALVVVMVAAPAQAFDVVHTPAPVTGSGTWFSGLGSPYGGCGMPQNVLDSQDFIALNVYNTPGDYSFYPRPLTGSNAAKAGMWDNGRNCGRFVKVSVSDYCSGVNDGAPNQAFCRNGSWVADKYNGATLTMLVADSCGDSNGWCRDDPYHIDLSHDSLNRFVQNGAPVGDMDPAHWNNRHVSWQFVSAPNYTGDIQIGFMQGAQAWWGGIALSHLPNGLHGVQYYSAGTWHDAVMNSDMGQSYVIAPLAAGGTNFRIRARDVTDAWINNGREYNFSLPSSCGTQCGAAYTKAGYTTTDPSGTPTPSPTQTATPSPKVTPTPTVSSSPTPSVTPTVLPTPSATPTVSSSPTPSVTPTVLPTPSVTTSVTATVIPTPSATAAGTCTATYRTLSSWPGGFQAAVTLTASTAISHWQVSWTPGVGQRVQSLWGGILSPGTGSAVTVSNASYNGRVGAGGAALIGFIGTGPSSAPVGGLSCKAA